MRELIQKNGGLFVPDHDFVENTYSGTNLTQIKYRRGGSTGDVVCTITMTYNLNDDIETLTRTIP
tara:strand:+ start:2025 stop:2219 length:195 start_codon:yes stop_codon:yes gene_type:complete